ncbi:MAG: Sec-independent protein translocase protein TatB, partial [Brevundimonas sp.]|uniref:Sec-independent protein translocase protein TatB n=1 Tax=Brevundimonas sp. TaxID=1871086 RepID=UPI00391D582F
MGGLGPGIGGFELLVIGLVALIVVGPKDLPLLMRKVGRVMARARAMASEFRASSDWRAISSKLARNSLAMARARALTPPPLRMSRGRALGPTPLSA